MVIANRLIKEANTGYKNSIDGLIEKILFGKNIIPNLVVYFLELDDADRRYYLDWFATLPLWLDLDGLRVVHACWHEPSIRTVREACGHQTASRRWSTSPRRRARGLRCTRRWRFCWRGPEIPVPQQYEDHGGKPRDKARLRWWDSDARTLNDLADVRGMKAVGGRDLSAAAAD